MSIQNINQDLKYSKYINTIDHRNDLFNKLDIIHHSVEEATKQILDSVASLNEVTYKENLIRLTTHYNELMKLNDSFYLSSMIDKTS